MLQLHPTAAAPVAAARGDEGAAAVGTAATNADTRSSSPAASSVSATITAEQELSWREKGYAVVDGLLPADLVAKVAAGMASHFVGSEETASKWKVHRDFGGVEFPSHDIPALNDLVLHESLLQVAAKLLRTDDIRLTQGDAWCKFFSDQAVSALDNREQRIHIDGWNHMLVAPCAWEAPAYVAMIVYLSEGEDCGGGTALVARTGPTDPLYQQDSFLNTPGVGSIPYINDRDSAEAYLASNAPEVAEFRKALYAREGVVQFHRGTVLLYRHDAWHRGTALTVPNSARFVVNLSYRRSDADWFQHWNRGWGYSMYTAAMTMEKIVASASVSQRALLGFPRPGHPYWTPTTLRVVAARYKCFGFDPTPYEQALASSIADHA